VKTKTVAQDLQQQHKADDKLNPPPAKKTKKK